MARVFPGGANTDNLACTISAYDSGPFTLFGWANPSGALPGNERITHIGTGTSGQILYNSGGVPSLEQQFSTAQILGFGVNAWNTGTWEFHVFTYDGSTLNVSGGAGASFFRGAVASSMVDLSSGITANIGSGTRTTGLTALTIGNRNSGLNRCWLGSLFCIGMVPWQMTLVESETLRTRNLSPVTAHGTPNFFFGLDGTNLNSWTSIGPSLTLTATGTTTTTDPITLFVPSSTTAVVTFRNRIIVRSGGL